MTGYERDLFGQRWADVDRNGCDQRNDVLARDLVVTSYKPGTRDCVVLTGTFDDPYTGSRIAFTRGQTSSMAVQIDHVVALADAWQTGAQTWGPKRMETFANDPLVLMAADGPANAQKGASDAASWLPANKRFRCTYVARQVAIKAKYDLWVKPAERDAIVRVLRSCPGQPLPSAGRVAVPDDVRAADPPVTTPPRSASPRPAATGGPDVEYANCDAVRAAGKAPILAGEPGYSSKLDRDGDGQGCDT
ncbi:MAG: excalibur calcium-binding domain-containing protein [Nocardioidaceae bacterium]|nr:excalibur calcium-binding domain-containing protein [Nocardioidaceae bacterium]